MKIHRPPPPPPKRTNVSPGAFFSCFLIFVFAVIMLVADQPGAAFIAGLYGFVACIAVLSP